MGTDREARAGAHVEVSLAPKGDTGQMGSGEHHGRAQNVRIGHHTMRVRPEH